MKQAKLVLISESAKIYELDPPYMKNQWVASLVENGRISFYPAGPNGWITWPGSFPSLTGDSDEQALLGAGYRLKD